MERMFESAMVHHLIDPGGPAASAALEWLVHGACPSPQQRVDVVWLSEPIRI